MIEDTPENIINQNFERIKISSKKRTAHSYEFRMDQLKKLETALEKFEKDIYDAKKKDLGMNEINSYLTTIFNVRSGNLDQKSKTLWPI